MKRYLLSIFILILSLGILIGCNDSVTEEIEEVRVKFIVDEEVYSSKKYEIGKKIKFPDIPYKEGYEFVGWYTNDDVELKEGIKATTKLTLYAKFEPIDETIELCTVNFYVGGKFFKSITVDVNSTIPSLPIPEIATGSEFNGWYTNDGTQFDQYTIVTESIDLFAKFEEEKTYYTVNFYDSIGGKLMYTERFEENSFVESIPKMEPPTGMVFVGWYDLDNEKYTVGMPITKDMDYHAIFVGMGEPTEYCTVNFYYGDVLVYSKKVEYGGELGEFELTPSPNENFLGWYTKGGMKYTEDILVYGDLDLYAKYEEVVEYCTLRYYYDLDFKLYDEIIVKKGSIIEFPVEPTKEGYVFTGWFIEDVTLAQEGLIVNCDLRLFARFIEELIFIFTYNEYDSCIEITGYIGNDEVVEIPSEINGKPVTEIASMAFENCTFKEIIIPDSVTTIGKHILYGCNNLEKLTTPFFENSSNILTNMFGGEIPTSAIFPPNLKEVTVTNMTDLTPYAFYNSGVEIINLPKNLVTIGNSAFDGCYNLKNITIPETVISIGIYAFSNTGLTYLHIPSSVEVLEENSIIFNYSLEELSICAKKVNSYAIQCASSLSILYIGNETVLADCAIYDTSYPNVVFTAQSEEDFAKNVSLGNNFSVETVIYDVSGTEFEYVAAENCSYYLSNTNKVYNFSFTPYWFGHNVHFLDEYVNGNELVSIANDAFGGCTGNGILIIPSTIKTIGSNITGYEDELSLSVYIEKENANDIIISQNNDFSSIYFYSEEEPTDFENYWHYIGSIPVIWPKPVKHQVLFIALDEVYKTIEVISGSEISLQDYYVDNIDYNDYSFMGWFDQDNNWYDPSASIVVTKDLILTADIYRTFTKVNYIFEYENVENKNPEKLYNYESIELIDPYLDGYEFMGWYTDNMYINKLNEYDLYGGKDIDLYGKFVLAYDYQIYENYAVITGYNGTSEEAVIPSVLEGKEVTTINSYIFQGSNIKSLVIPNTVTYIGYGILQDCTNIEELTIPFIGDKAENLSYDLKYLFVNEAPQSLKKITLTNTITISSQVSNMPYIEEICLSNKTEYIDEKAFDSCSNLRYVYLPKSLKTFNSNDHFIQFYYEGTKSYWDNNVYFTHDGNIDSFYINYYFDVYENIEEYKSDRWIRFKDVSIIVQYRNDHNFAIAYHTDYSVYPNHQVVICKYIGDSSTVYVPSSFGSYTVVDFLEGAFTTPQIENIAFDPNLQIREIKDYAFNHQSLKSFDVPYTITKIGKGAFMDCFNMKSIVLHAGIKEIADDAFSSCFVEEIYFKGNEEAWNAMKERIDLSMFNDAVVYFYSDTQPNEDMKYWHYTNESGTNIPTVWRYTDVELFEYIIHNETISLEYKDYHQYIEITGFNGKKEDALIIPRYIEGIPVCKIAEHVFENNTFDIIELPYYLVEMKDYSFANSLNVKHLTLPGTLLNIAPTSLLNTPKLESFSSIGMPMRYNITNYDENGNATAILDWDTYTIVKATSNSILPLHSFAIAMGFPISIGDYAYAYNSFEHIYLFDNISSISPLAFVGCENVVVYFGGSSEQWNIIAKDASVFEEVYFNDEWTIVGTEFVFCNYYEGIHYKVNDEGEIVMIGYDHSYNYLDLTKIDLDVKHILIDIDYDLSSQMTFVVHSQIETISLKNSASYIRIFATTEEDWNKIEVIDNCLDNSIIRFYSEERPSQNVFNYWYYAENGEPVVWNYS